MALYGGNLYRDGILVGMIQFYNYKRTIYNLQLGMMEHNILYVIMVKHTINSKSSPKTNDAVSILAVTNCFIEIRSS